MASATVHRIGAINAGTDKTALFLKVFGGEVLTAFETAAVSLDKHTVRTISSGKSAQFPATWKVSSSLHTPGNEIVGQSVNHNEKIVTIDGLLIADVFLANIDEAMNHYDARSIYTVEAGRALAKAWDLNVFRMGLLASQASTERITGAPSGMTSGAKVKNTAAEGAPSSTTGNAIAALIYSAAQTLDEKDVPEYDRYAFMRPAQYYALINGDKVIHRDYRGAGSYAAGKVFAVADVTIVKSNNVVRDATVSSTVPSGKYDVTGTDSFGLVMTPQAVGTVKLMDLAMEQAYDIRRQGHLIVAKYAIGTDILRAECCVELSWAA
jgi:hypothetical protein